ncbi:MAG TPA: hypothetical protein VF841_02350 [Anaeromyxobacter sp.]
MWMRVRFSLSGGGERAYREALEILRGAGFGPEEAGAGEPIEVGAPFPAAVIADVRREPAEVTRAVFSALRAAGLRPLGVSGAPVALPPAARARASA